MSAEVPHPIDQVEYGVPYHPWTEEELKKSLNKFLGRSIPNPGIRIATKPFNLGRIEYVCMLSFCDPDNIAGAPDAYFVPFPDDTKFEIDEQTEGFKSIPLILDVGRLNGESHLFYTLKLEGISLVDGISDTEANGDIMYHGVIIDGDVKDTLLPSQPKRLSTMELTFSRQAHQSLDR